jgi:integrase
MTGNITRRGKSSWRLKYEGGERSPTTGKRSTRYATVRGTKKEAQVELTRLLAEIDAGVAVDPSKITVAEYVRGWLDGADALAGKTRERYRQLAEQQIIPHLGTTILQKLRPAQIADWHAALLKGGGMGGKPLSARTVGHAHRVLHAALARAARLEIISRNVASVVKPPKVEVEEVEILAAEQIGAVLATLKDHPLYPIVALALGTGARRGELCALRWGDVDLDGATIRIDRSMEETMAGLKAKAPKTRNGRRTISLPASVVDTLRAHRVQQLGQRLALGLGRPGADDLVFTMPDCATRSPDNLSRDWRRTVLALGLPPVMFHALRHSHASALIAAGLDVQTISRRLGHASAAFTLNTYTHLFADKADEAARAMDAAMTGGGGAKA